MKDPAIIAAALPDDFKRSAAFYWALDNEDDVGAIIRGAGYVQDLLLQLYVRNVERLDLIDPTRLSYSSLIRLALTFGEITDELATALKLLAKIRNPLAHDLMHKLDADSVSKFYDALPAAPYKFTSEALLGNADLFSAMSDEARLLRVGLMQVALELVTCRDQPLPRGRLPSGRVQL
jgi:hypothetical protein